MNYDHLFIPGQEVSAFVKNSNKIWEGIIVERSDGVKVVLNESTKNWKRLADLEHIKRTGHLLYEDNHTETATDLIKDFNSFTQSTLSKGDEKELETVAKDPSKKEQLANHLTTISKANPDIKDAPSSPQEAVKTVDENLANVLANKKAEQAPGDQAAIEAAKTETDKLIGQQVNETLNRLHPLIKKQLNEMSAQTFHHCREYFNETHDKEKTIKMLKLYGMKKEAAVKLVKQWEQIGIELGEVPSGTGLHESVDEDDLVDFMRDKLEGGKFERADFEQIKDYLQDNDKGGATEEKEPSAKEKKDAIKGSIEFEDEDYLDIPDEVKRDVIAKVKELLANNEEDIEDAIKSSFELTDDDAEEFIVIAMEEYLNETDVEPRNSIKQAAQDPVEQDFEDTIEKFEGPDGELLDHLVDEYEIDPGEAEKIYDEKDGNLEECIYAFVNIVRNRLKESDWFPGTQMYRSDIIGKGIGNAAEAISNFIGAHRTKKPHDSEQEKEENWNNLIRPPSDEWVLNHLDDPMIPESVKKRLTESKPVTFDQWPSEKVHAWLTSIEDAEDPGESRKWPNGYHASHLVPPGVKFPPEVISKLLDCEIDHKKIAEIVSKIFPGFHSGNVMGLIKMFERDKA
jgi:hypothetical protein